jgi:hypothetical protein
VLQVRHLFTFSLGINSIQEEIPSRSLNTYGEDSDLPPKHFLVYLVLVLNTGVKYVHFLIFFVLQGCEAVKLSGLQQQFLAGCIILTPLPLQTENKGLVSLNRGGVAVNIIWPK